MLGFVWTGRNPTTGLESTRLRARTRIFISTKFQPRVRLVIPILRMRNTSIQTFYGQIASFPSIMIRMLHFMITKSKVFWWDKGRTFFYHFRRNLVVFLATFAGYQPCFWPLFCRVIRLPNLTTFGTLGTHGPLLVLLLPA